MIYQPKCPSCNGRMWSDYDNWMSGKDYYWKCSHKKKDNPHCTDKKIYWECDKCGKIDRDWTCVKPGFQDFYLQFH